MKTTVLILLHIFLIYSLFDGIKFMTMSRVVKLQHADHVYNRELIADRPLKSIKKHC